MTDSPPVVQAEFDALLELLDAATMREVVAMFAASAPDRLASAASGLAAGDGTVMATAFHTMRSGCGQLGARRLEELCATAERAAKGGELAGARERLAEVQVEYARCLAWFRANDWLND